jgi:TPR repeat protein
MLRIHTAVIGVLLVILMGMVPTAGFAQDVKATDKPAQEPSELFWAAIEEARWGEPEAQYMVANMYEKGEGVEKDPKEAAMWYEKAAEQGHPSQGRCQGRRMVQEGRRKRRGPGR